jgi:hypothetical protein
MKDKRSQGERKSREKKEKEVDEQSPRSKVSAHIYVLGSSTVINAKLQALWAKGHNRHNGLACLFLCVYMSPFIIGYKHRLNL